MTDVKAPRRPYDSRRRRAQATERRQAILDAAQALFLESGWIRTTIAAVARRAGASSETIYATFGNKESLLREVVVRAVRGPDLETPLIRQARTRRVAEDPDQGRQIAMFAGEIETILARVAPLMEVVRTAAGTDAGMAALYADLHRGRRANLDWFAAALLNNGPLRGGLDAEAAGGLVWRLASPELYLLLRRVEGMSQDDYVDWLRSTLTALLLDR